MTETSALRELDAAIARVLGCDVFASDASDIFGENLYCRCNDARHAYDGYDAEEDVFGAFVARYSSDARAIVTVEEEIARRGLGDHYAHELQLAVLGEAEPYVFAGNLFALLRASPEQRCRAALQAIAHDSQPANGVDQ